MQNIKISSPELANIDASNQTASIIRWNSLAPSEGFLISVAAVAIAISIVSVKLAAFQNLIGRI